MANTTTTDRADGQPAEALASRDWYGDAQRRIDGLWMPGAWGDNPDVPKMGTRLGRTPGIALLRQAQRSPAHVRVARTLTTPEEHPALRQPLKPATWRPMLTFQSPAAAALARLEAPVGPADGGEAGDLEAPVIRTPTAPQSRIPFVRRIFRLLDPRPETLVEPPTRLQPRSIPPMLAHAEEVQPASTRSFVTELSPAIETPPLPAAPPRASTEPPAPQVVARHPAQEDEAPSIEAAPPTVLRQPSSEATAAPAPRTSPQVERPTSEDPRASTPLATFARRVLRREAASAPKAPAPVVAQPRSLEAPRADVDAEQPAMSPSDATPTMAPAPFEASTTPVQREVPPPRLDLRTDGPVIERRAPEAPAEATLEAAALHLEAGADAPLVPAPAPAPALARPEAAPTATQAEATPTPESVESTVEAAPAPHLEAPPALLRVESPEPVAVPSLVRRILRRITRSPEPNAVSPSVALAPAASAARRSTVSPAQTPVFPGDVPARANAAPAVEVPSDPRFVLRHEAPVEDAADESSVPAVSSDPPAPAAQETPREDGPTPLQLTPRIEPAPAAMTTPRAPRIDTPVAPRPQALAPPAEVPGTERTPLVEGPRWREQSLAMAVDLVVREEVSERPSSTRFARPSTEDRAALDAPPPTVSPVSPPTTVLRRTVDAAAPVEVRRVFRRPAPESGSAPTSEAGPQAVHADALARELGFAPTVARGSQPGPTPAARVASAVRRAEEPSVARHAAAPATDEDIFRQARAEGGPVAVLRAETSEAPTDVPAPSDAEAAAAAPAEPDAQALDRLAQAVYTRLRRRFVVERERAGRGERWS